MSATDPKYQPIASHIADYGMVLVERKIIPLDGMYGRVEQSWYATPEARNLLFMFPADEDRPDESDTTQSEAVRLAG